MCPTKVLTVIILLIILQYQTKNQEGFTNQKEIKHKSRELYQKKKLFYPDAKYSNVKSSIPWIDPVVYNDVYTLSLKEKLTISNLENTLSNSIK